MSSRKEQAEKLRLLFRSAFHKMEAAAIKAVSFLNRHKILTCIAAFILILSAAIVGIGNHYLNKINYDDGIESTVFLSLSVQTTAQPSFEGVILENGSKVFSDGSYVTKDLTAVLSDGTSVFQDSKVIFQDGKSYKKTKIKVDYDGYLTIGDTKLHISVITLNKNGSVSYKDGSALSLQYVSSSSAGTTVASDNSSASTASTQEATVQAVSDDDSDDADRIIQEAKSDSESGKVLKDSDTQIEENIKNNKIWYNDSIINILIMGIDNGSANFPYGRSDSMIVASVNKKTKQVKLVSLARSAYVSIKGYPNTRMNHAHGYGGAALAMDTVERNYRIRIDNYISTDFDSFKQLIDLLGGVDITLTKKEASAMKQKLKSEGYTYKGAGKYKLNGETALYYVRLRKIDTDRQRTQRQRNVLTSIAGQIQGMGFFELNSLLNKILPLITTNLSKVQIVSQLANVSTYLSNGIEQDVLPNKTVPLTLRDGYEVAIVDWDYEVDYAHKLFYSGVTPSYKEG